VTRVLTIGTFDVPHLGHAYLFQQCLRLGDELVVGVNSDRFVGSYKGISPAFDQDERMEMIGALGYRVELNDSAGRDLIYRVRPDVLAIGDDWMPGRKDYMAQIDMTPDDFDALRCTLAFIPVRIQSTTRIKERLA
jgi:cytidyltransferase-like protein